MNKLIEYACYDEPLADKVKKNVFEAIDLGANSISVPIIHMNAVSTIIPDGIVLSCPIDYPRGAGDTELRIHQILKAIRQGATTVDVVANHTLHLNKKSQDCLHDLRTLQELCDEKTATLRVIFDSRQFDNGKKYSQFIKVGVLAGIEYAYCSTGHLAEDATDNIIMCQAMQKNHDSLHVIANGGIYLPKHIEAVDKADLFGVRFHNINALKNCLVGV